MLEFDDEDFEFVKAAKVGAVQVEITALVMVAKDPEIWLVFLEAALEEKNCGGGVEEVQSHWTDGIKELGGG